MVAMNTASIRDGKFFPFSGPGWLYADPAFLFFPRGNSYSAINKQLFFHNGKHNINISPYCFMHLFQKKGGIAGDTSL